MPGIRPAGSGAGDQKRTHGAGRRVAAGADVLVIGRPITEARDPRAAAQAIDAEIAGGAGGLSHGARGQDLRPDRRRGARRRGRGRRPLARLRLLSALAARAQPRSGPATLAGAAPADRTTVGVLVDPDDAAARPGPRAGAARRPAAARRREPRARVAAIKARTGRARDQGAAGRRAARTWRPSRATPRSPTCCCSTREPPRSPAACRAATASPSTGGCCRACGSAARGCSRAGCRPTTSRPRSRLCRPPAVDVSSGVEDRPGHKDPAKIRRFLALARGLAVRRPPDLRNLPRAPADDPARTPIAAGPDARGRFGIYGGRFVAETLMPLILELEQAYEAAKADPAFQAELDACSPTTSAGRARSISPSA